MKLSDRIEQMVHPVHALPQEIDSLLENWFGYRSKPGQRDQSTFRPRTNVVEQEQEFVISMELPGILVSDVAVESSEDKLTISGEKKIEIDEATEKLHRGERVTGKFERAFEFPTQVDFDLIKANFQYGVLTVTVPKSAKVMPRKIQINVSD